MGSGEAVRVAWPAIRRRLRQNGGDSVYIVVKVPGVKGSPDDLLADMQAAMERANAAMDRDGEELVWAQAVIPSAKGPMVDLDWIGTDEQTEEWLDTFAEALAGLGRAGTITAAPHVFFPQDFGEYWEQSRLTSFLGLAIEDPLGFCAADRGHRWPASEDLTRDWCRFAVDWGAIPGAAIYLGEATSEVLLEDPYPAEALTTAAIRSRQARVAYLLGKPYRTRSADFYSSALVSFQAGADLRGAATPAWRDQAATVTASLLHRPESLDYAMIRPAVGLAGAGWIANIKRPEPYVDDSLWMINRHMWSRLVPDAHGTQLLTRQHLDQARDLSAWSVTEVAEGRFLVQATDLAPWWDTYTPDPDVQASARHDFGPMIMTRADIEADPHGWLPGRGRPNEQ